MAKVKVFVEENVRYWSEIIVDVPEDMNVDVFEDILDTTEKEVNDSQGNVSDMVSAFEDQGLKVVDYEDNFPEDPIMSEISIYDAMDVDDEY
ncbi:hypothetical protein [Bacillus licheniformis]|nr:hypothetical protein B4089_3583 [Bacillus licheniformis]OLF87286.1 hypothetical protein B4089_3756 [Bacillus licheniformis]